MVAFTALINMTVFIGLYALLVEIGCSQFDKLKAALLDIKQDENKTDQQLQQQLNNCIQQHQIILK